MKYVYTEGPYKEFRGYQFVNGKPVTILDNGTVEALSKRSDFRRVDDEERKDPDEGKNADERQEALLGIACPKCGRVVMRGRYMHIKYCKGE